jgi:hypothetical protein
LQAAKKDGDKNGAGIFIAKLFKVIFICCDDFTQPKQIINNLKTLKELALSSSSELPFVSFTEEKFISYLFSNNIESINIILERLYACIINNISICPKIFNEFGFNSLKETNKILNDTLI